MARYTPLYTREEQNTLRGSAYGSSKPPPDVQWWRDALVDEWRLKHLYPSEAVVLALLACGFEESEVRWITRKTKEQLSGLLSKARARVKKQEEARPAPQVAREKWARRRALWSRPPEPSNSTESSTPKDTTSPASEPDAPLSG